MSYEESLKAAGAVVFEFKEFGDYQGSWCALVEYQGNFTLVQGSYGSCSGCDAFQSEFDYKDEEEDPNYKQRLKDFGLYYLDNPIPLEEAITKVTEDLQWDLDSEGKLNWLKSIDTKKFNDKLHKIVEE